MPDLDDYAPIVGHSVIGELYELAKRVRGTELLHINSTAMGGGVAEILTHMVPLLRQLGLVTRWEVIKGDARFYRITKTMHNAIHGMDVGLSNGDMEHFRAINRMNAGEIDLSADHVIVHDPQPIGLVMHRERGGSHWAWRCHVDFSQPRRWVWDMLRPYISRFDTSVFSAPQFARPLSLPQVMIPPSIDPLSDKNREIDPARVDKIARGFELDPDLPLITQISRFDRLKDPIGVIKAFSMVRKHIRCQLLLAGGTATDDPESLEVLAQVKKAARAVKDVHVLCFDPPATDLEINALQRASAIVVQKSLKEGFALTVSESLWKGKPVVASAVGGIPLQVIHNQTGLLVRGPEGAAKQIKRLLNSPELRERLGSNGREHVRMNFLITTHIRNLLLLLLAMEHSEELVYL